MKEVYFNFLFYLCLLLLFQRCIPPPELSSVTYKINNITQFLSDEDTLWVIPSIVQVKIRYAKNEIADDEPSIQRAKIYMKNGIKRLFSDKLILIDTLANDSLNLRIYSEYETMLVKFKNENFTTYSISNSLQRALQKAGIKKCLFTKLYWEYYGYYFYQKEAIRTISATNNFSADITSCKIFLHSAMFNVKENKLDYFNESYIGFMYPFKPKGYESLPDGTSPERNYNFPDNQQINGRLNASLRGFIHHIKHKKTKILKQ